jgi:hypothetical protein
MRAGANPEHIEVFVEANPQTGRVRATAVGTTEMRAQDLRLEINADEGRAIAATSMGVPVGQVELKARTELMWVYQGHVKERRYRLFTSMRSPVRVLDRQGFIKVQRANGIVYQVTGASAVDDLKRIWESLTIYNGDSLIFPDLFLIIGSHVVDLTGMQSVQHALGLVSTELDGVKPEEQIAIVGVRGSQGF